MGAHRCQVDATCINTVGGFNCTCNPGYGGDGFNCTGIWYNFKVLSVIVEYFYATITVYAWKWCLCLTTMSFWILQEINKITILDVNECLTNDHDCHPDANCLNKIGSYNCTCHSGYSGNGTICTGVLSIILKKKQDVTLSSNILIVIRKKIL